MDLLKTILPLYGNPTPSGCTPEEIDILKQRFGTIPQVVEDFYRLAAKTHPFHTAQDTWILPENYKTWPWLQKIDASSSCWKTKASASPPSEERT